MPVPRLIVVLLAGLVLAGCFQTGQEFVSAAEADFPFESLTYRTDDDDETYTLVRKGDAYRSEEDDTTVRLKNIGKDSWLVQTAFVDEGTTLYLYGIAVMAPGGKAFKVYKVLAEDADRDPARMAKYGLALCPDDDENICLPSADVYIAYVRDRIAAGDEPSGSFLVLDRK